VTALLNSQFSILDSIDLLHGLVGIPSISGDEAAAAQWLVSQMAELGLSAHLDAAGNAVGIAGSGSPLTVLLGHIDTVPGDIPVRIEDGRLWGRGAVDAKGPLATFVSVAARLAHSGKLRGQIVVLGCVEEEAPSSRGAHHAVHHYRPDYCIVGEPSGWSRVTLGYKGALRLHVRAEAACGHSAHERTTAAEHIAAFWQAVQTRAQSFNQGRARAFDRLLPALLRLGGDSDGLREWATADINLRLPPDLAPAALLEELQAAHPALLIDALGSTPAYAAPRTTPLVRALTGAIRTHGAQPGLVLKTGTADLNVVAPVWGCPSVAYGPGDAALDHTPDEHIVLDEYLRSIQVLEAALLRLHKDF